MRIDIVSLFPEMFEDVLGHSILKIAKEKNLVQYNLFNIREYADNRQCVDDRPYGGGPGMVIKPEPVFNTIEAIGQQTDIHSKKILLTPQGHRFNQSIAKELAREPYLMLICGHYEGFDARIRMRLDAFELSIGDYVLSGGEIPAMVVIDAVVRLIPGVLGDLDSVVNESFSARRLCTEFGRMPTFQKDASGRDHNPEGFTCWLAGAGVKAPFSYGQTDEFGYKAVDNIVTVHDFHATILHLLGLDHQRLTFYYNGLERRLTDVDGTVVREVLA